MLLVFQRSLWASVMCVEESRNQTVINHSFHGLKDTTAQCFRAVIIRIFGFFSGLVKGMTLASLQKGGNSPVSQRFLKGTDEKLQEDVLKFGSVYDPVQELCHGICQAQS